MQETGKISPLCTRRGYRTCRLLLNRGLAHILIFLVPDHVPIYHEWMKDPDLLEATGSEPLSYDEEIQMQQSWLNDETKCTFIVHAPFEDCTLRCKDIDNDNNEEEEDHEDVNKSHDENFDAKESKVRVFHVADNLSTMIGDVNLFLSEIDDEDDSDDDDENISEDLDHKRQQKGKPKENVQEGRISKLLSTTTTTTTSQKKKLQAEIDIMIAKSECRRQGFAFTATIIMLLYGVKKLDRKSVV